MSLLAIEQTKKTGIYWIVITLWENGQDETIIVSQDHKGKEVNVCDMRIPQTRRVFGLFKHHIKNSNDSDS